MLIKAFSGLLTLLYCILLSIVIMYHVNVYSSQSDDDFKKYRDYFTEITGVTSDVTINFRETLKGNAIGICYYTLFGNYVKIDKEWWDKSSTLKRTAVILHELAHCECYVGHEEGVRLNGCNESLRGPSIGSSSCLRKHWKDYKVKLRRSCNE